MVKLGTCDTNACYFITNLSLVNYCSFWRDNTNIKLKCKNFYLQPRTTSNRTLR